MTRPADASAASSAATGSTPVGRTNGPLAVVDPRSPVARRAVTATVALASLTLVALAVIGAIVGSVVAGLVVGVVLAGIIGAAVWTRSERWVLRLGRAEPAGETAYARYHNVIEGLCVASGVPKPNLYVVADDAPNVFVAGRGPRSASIAVTTGLLDRCDRVELEGVLAHLLCRVKSHEILAGTMAVPTAGIVVLGADLLARASAAFPPFGALAGGLLVPARWWAQGIEAVAGPSHLSETDLDAVALTRYPPGLISALEHLEQGSTVVAAGSRATAHLWVAAPLSINQSVDPLGARNEAFLTHEPLNDRIELLREL